MGIYLGYETPDSAPIPTPRPGGLASLGGMPQQQPSFLQSDNFGNILQALGISLMGSPRNAPLMAFGPALQNLQQASADRRSTAQQQAATEQALIEAGMSPEQARVMAANPQAAKFTLDQRQERRDQEAAQAQRTQTMQFLAQNDPEIAAMVEAGMSPNEGFNLYAKKRQGGDLTDTQKNLLWRAQQAGLQPGTREYVAFMRSGGSGDGITVNNMGNIPVGYEVQYDEQGRPVSMAPVPGSPAALDAGAAAEKAALRENQQAITSDTVINAANAARDAMAGATLPATGNFSAMISDWLPESNAAEVRRQVNALTAVAASENINAMRQASPTGGALGNASDADIKLLKDKAGALDLNAGPERFSKALDDYERTLLRIVHGKSVGDAIFDQSRRGTDKSISEMSDAELEAIINGKR